MNGKYIEWWDYTPRCRYHCIKYADEAIQVVVYMGRLFTQVVVRAFFSKYWVKIKSLFANSGYLPNRIRRIRKSKG